MNYIVRKAGTLSSDEKIALNILGIPDNWPIETLPYEDTIPTNFVVMTAAELSQLKGDNQTEYNTWAATMTNTASAAQAYVEKRITAAINFGQKLVTTYAAQNVLLGITQSGMTGTVRARMANVLLALQTGSLYDVIIEAKAIPSEHKDGTYITDARLLNFVNKVELYLGITLSTSL